MPFLNPYSVLWIVIWSMVLFVVAPHLDVVCKSAARTVRLGSFALLVTAGAPLLAMFARVEVLFSFLGLLGALGTALFFGSLAVAAWQIVQGAPKKRELQ
jgi:hypothetical protein